MNDVEFEDFWDAYKKKKVFSVVRSEKYETVRLK